MNACPQCGNTETMARTFRLPGGTVYTLRYFTCKHPLDSAPGRDQTSATAPSR